MTNKVTGTGSWSASGTTVNGTGTGGFDINVTGPYTIEVRDGSNKTFNDIINGFGTHKVLDIEPSFGTDVIGKADSQTAALAAINADTKVVGGNDVITLGHETITLVGFHSPLTTSDFHFG